MGWIFVLPHTHKKQLSAHISRQALAFTRQPVVIIWLFSGVKVKNVAKKQ
jgi:hypothetical protein